VATDSRGILLVEVASECLLDAEVMVPSKEKAQI
jgi:hypothetical protein